MIYAAAESNTTLRCYCIKCDFTRSASTSYQRRQQQKFNNRLHCETRCQTKTSSDMLIRVSQLKGNKQQRPNMSVMNAMLLRACTANHRQWTEPAAVTSSMTSEQVR